MVERLEKGKFYLDIGTEIFYYFDGNVLESPSGVKQSPVDGRGVQRDLVMNLVLQNPSTYVDNISERTCEADSFVRRKLGEAVFESVQKRKRAMAEETA